MSADPRHLYVAGSGSDDDPGTEARPLATLHRARDFARELRSSAARRIEVVVRGGAYHLSEPLILTAQDSGSHAAPLRFSAYPGERVILSGGALLQLQWEPYRDGIVRAAVPAGSDFDQLFVANRRQMRARYPSFDPERPLMGEGGYVNAVGGSDEPGREELIFDPASFTTRHWPRPSEAVVHVFPSHYWHNAQYRITEIDWERSAIRLGEGGWQTHRFLAPNSFSGKSRFFVDNVFEELDTPGEWYLDSAANVLYYLPPPEIDLESAEVVAPRLERLVELRGSRHDPVRHVRFEGFSFTHTRATYLAPYEVPSTGDWGIHRGGAVLLEGAEDCTVLNSTFDAVGGNALFISNHARRIRIAGNTFVDTGDSAVCLCGRNNMVEAEWRCEYCGAGRPLELRRGGGLPGGVRRDRQPHAPHRRLRQADRRRVHVGLPAQYRQP